VIGCVIAGVVGVFIFRKVLKSKGGDVEQSALMVSSALNAIQIQVFNVFYGWCAVKLNDYENHRTQSDYENALIGKSFIFKFVNSYNTLFYIAFFKQFDSTVHFCAATPHDGGISKASLLKGPPYVLESVPAHDCLKELQTQLGVVFVLLIVINNAVEIIAPMYAQYAAAKENRAVDAQGKEIIKTLAEVEFELAPYESTFDDFDEMAIQYGYVSLFVVAFPLAPLLALISNATEVRLDATKMCKFNRRPHPRGAADIGMWYDIMNVVSFMAVITNIAVIVIETAQFTKYTTSERFLIFLGTEHFLMFLKMGIGFLIPDMPEEIGTHLARQEYLSDVLIGGLDEPAIEAVPDD